MYLRDPLAILNFIENNTLMLLSQKCYSIIMYVCTIIFLMIREGSV